jgi:copper chaperone CopZ
MSKALLKIGEMSCNHCKQTVENALRGLAGVDSVEVDLKNKSASVVYDPARCGVPAMKAALEEEGFTAE